jgi:hypothetical protein
MKIQELIGTLLADSTRLGAYTLPELIKFTRSKSMNGIAVAVSGDREFDLAFLEGEPEGAILIEEKGILYGDKAVMLLSGNEMFDLYEVKPDLVEAVAVGCRILEKEHICRSGMDVIPEIGRKSDGIGVLSIAVLRKGEPQNGVRVSIRKDGQMISNDVTTRNGTVGFRLLYGNYDCVVQDRAMMIATCNIVFTAGHSKFTLEI